MRFHYDGHGMGSERGIEGKLIVPSEKLGWSRRTDCDIDARARLSTARSCLLIPKRTREGSTGSASAGCPKGMIGCLRSSRVCQVNES